MSARITSIIVCDACGTVIPEGNEKIVLGLDGYEYKFDSERCMQTFRKLIEVYGREFFRSTRH